MKKVFKLFIIMLIIPFLFTNVYAEADGGIGLTQDKTYMPSNASEVGNVKLKWTEKSEYSRYRFERFSNTTNQTDRWTPVGEASASAGEIILDMKYSGTLSLRIIGINYKGEEFYLNNNYGDNSAWDLFDVRQYASMDYVTGAPNDVMWTGQPVDYNLYPGFTIAAGTEKEATISRQLLALKDFSTDDLTSIGTITATMYGSSLNNDPENPDPLIKGERQVSYNIIQRDLSNSEDHAVKLVYDKAPSGYYNGQPQTYTNPRLVLDNFPFSDIPIPEENYDFVYENNVGKSDEDVRASIKFTGKNNCTGEITFNFTIKYIRNIEDKTPTSYYYIEEIPEQEYTGFEIRPSITVASYNVFDGTPLSLWFSPSNYSVEYIDNINPGTAFVRVHGLPEKGYKGTLEASFQIVDVNGSFDPEGEDRIELPEVSLKANNNTVTLSWQNQPNAKKYEVATSTDNKNWKKLGTTTEDSYVIKSLTYGKTYYYKVRVHDGKSWTKYSKVVKKKIVPNKVTNLTILSAGSNNIKLGYDRVKTTGYEISRSTDNKKWTKVATIKDNETVTYNNKKLSANKKYYYKVRAYKTVSGNKVYGSWSNVVNTKTAPAKPKLTISVRDYTSLNIKVGESKGAVKYIIQKSIDNKTFELLTELDKYGTHKDLDLTTGKTYYYRVKACNSSNRCSGWVTGSLKVKPSKPTLTLKTPKTKKVEVTLSSVTGADGYEVYRATSKTGKYTLIKKLTSLDELTFLNGTKKGKKYYYKARSFTLINEGTKKVYSDYSSIKNITSK